MRAGRVLNLGNFCFLLIFLKSGVILNQIEIGSKQTEWKDLYLILSFSSLYRNTFTNKTRSHEQGFTRKTF